MRPKRWPQKDAGDNSYLGLVVLAQLDLSSRVVVGCPLEQRIEIVGRNVDFAWRVGTQVFGPQLERVNDKHSGHFAEFVRKYTFGNAFRLCDTH
jgi:hypothetical protein